MPSHPLNSRGERQLKWALGSDNRIEWEKKRATRMSKRSREMRKQQVTWEIHALPESNAMGESRRQRGCRETEMALCLPILPPWYPAVIVDVHIQMPLWRQLPTQSSNKGIALQLPSEENLVFPWTFSTRTGGKAYGKGNRIIYHSNWDTLKEQKGVPLPIVRHKEA